MIAEYIIIALGLCFALFGLAELMHGIRLKLMLTGKKPFTYTVIYLSGSDPAGQIRFAAEQKKWHGSAYSDRIIAVNNGISPAQENECRFAATQCGVLYLSAEKLPEALVFSANIEK